MAVRVIKHEFINVDVAYEEIAGLSTDDKPVNGLATGSKFFEVNTGDTYYFDEDGDTGNEWVNPLAQS